MREILRRKKEVKYMIKRNNVLSFLLTVLFLIVLAGSAIAGSQYPGVLGTKITVTETDGNTVYNGVWTRRADTDIFDAVWNGCITDVIEIESVNGNQIVLYRQGNGGRYYCNLSADGSKILSGTADWYGPGWYWGGNITGNTGLPAETGEYTTILVDMVYQGTDTGEFQSQFNSNGASAEHHWSGNFQYPYGFEVVDCYVFGRAAQWDVITGARLENFGVAIPRKDPPQYSANDSVVSSIILAPDHYYTVTSDYMGSTKDVIDYKQNFQLEIRIKVHSDMQ